MQNKMHFQMHSGWLLGAILARKLHQVGGQMGTQNHPKPIPKRHQKTIASQSHAGNPDTMQVYAGVMQARDPSAP